MPEFLLPTSKKEGYNGSHGDHYDVLLVLHSDEWSGARSQKLSTKIPPEEVPEGLVKKKNTTTSCNL